MSAFRHDSVLLSLIKRVDYIQSILRKVTVNLPLFDIANENTPTQLTTDQNNYVIGNYDVLQISSDKDVNITGLRGGVKGRFLEILNAGDNRISFLDDDTNSDAENRIATPYNETIVILPNARVRFYYDSSKQRWTLADAPNIQGQFGRSALVGGASVITVPTATETKVTFDTVFSDDWGYFDSANNRFVVPNGETGTYLISLTGGFDSAVSGGTLRQVRITIDGGATQVAGLGVSNRGGIATNICIFSPIRLTSGNYIEFYVRQDSGSDLNYDPNAAYFSKLH